MSSNVKSVSRSVLAYSTAMWLACVLAASHAFAGEPLRSETDVNVSTPAGAPVIDGAGDAAAALIDKVRSAAARYLDINVAFGEGYVVAAPCTRELDSGAVGMHLVLPSGISSGVLKAEQPQALIYEPVAGGAMRLVGVEFIVLRQVWESSDPQGGVPALEGNLLSYVGAPNLYGLPAFYEIHVWLKGLLRTGAERVPIGLASLRDASPGSCAQMAKLLQ